MPEVFSSRHNMKPWLSADERRGVYVSHSCEARACEDCQSDWPAMPRLTWSRGDDGARVTPVNLPQILALLLLDSSGANVFILLCLLHDVATQFCLSAQFLS